MTLDLAKAAKADIVRSQRQEILRRWDIQAKHVIRHSDNYRGSMVDLALKFLSQHREPKYSG